MGVQTWRRWLRSLLHPPTRTLRRRRSDLVLEVLEDRAVPATFTWKGGGADANWSTVENWVEGQAPGGGAAALDDLVFPTSSVTTTNNDLNNAVFNSITFTGSNYTLTGNALTLGDASALGSGNIIVQASPSAQIQTISLDLQLGGAGGRQSFTVEGSHRLIINGALTGNANVELTKFGTGRLVLGGDNNAFAGPITVDTNAGVLEVTHENALGGTAQGTVIGTSSELHVNVTGNTADFGEDLILNGTGINGDGVLKNTGGDSTWSGDIKLDSDVVLSVSSGTSLDIAGQISDLGFGYSLKKEGTGTLIFSSANTYRGSTEINDGILEIQHPLALGTANGDEASGTLVNRTNTKAGTLRLNDPSTNATGFTVAGELLTLNGAGAGNIGALYSAAGNNTWSGNIQLGSGSGFGSDVAIGVQDAFALTITGLMDDTNGIRNWAKIDSGTLILTRNNEDFAGAIAVQAGILNIRDSGALGSHVSEEQRVTLSGSLTGTFRLTFAGQTFDDALPVTATADDVRTELEQLSNIGVGDVSVTKSGSTFIITFQGALANTDQPELTGSGQNGTTVSIVTSREGARGTTVANGATLQLEIDNIPDSATNTTNRLEMNERLTIQGLGVGGQGALVSVSGLNVYAADITVGGTDTGIGVLPDPNPTNTTGYFVNDYSLTITGDLIGGGSNTISKLGTGHLILPEANNQFSGPFNIQAGWVTIHDNNSLGLTRQNTSQTNQSTVTVGPGAALHLYPLTGNLTLPYNFVLAGSGMDHPFALIDQQGAIENLNGINTIPGNIILRGQVGIGVEHVFGPSQLYLTGAISETTPIINVSGNASGGPEEDINVIDTGSTSGTLTLNPQVFSISDDVRIYLGDFENDRANAILVYDSTTNGNPQNPTNQFRATITVVYDSTTATATAVHLPRNPGGGGPFNGDGAGYELGPVVTTYAGLTSTAISIVVNEGGSTQNITQWNYTASIVPSGVFGGGISKLGSKLLVMQNEGTYTGDNDVRAGVILVQSDTALGHNRGRTIVHSGTSLLLANGTPFTSGGGQFGLHIWGEHLKLSGPGNTTLGPTYNLTAGPPLAPLTILEDDTVPKLVDLNNFITDVIVPSEHLWRGRVSLDTSVALDIPTDTRLTILGAIDDTANTAGSDLVKIGAGELILGGASTYRGTTYVGTSATINPTVGGNTRVNDFFDSGNPQRLPGGIVTVAHSQALGSSGNAEEQTVTVTGSSSGTFTLTFRTEVTDPLSRNATAAAVADALNALPSIRDVGGSVAVTKAGNVFTITFGGSLFGSDQEQIDAQGSGGATATEDTVTEGRGGTVVQDGTTLQLQGNLTVAGESLILEGDGVDIPPDAPVPTWFNIGPAPVLNAVTLGTNTSNITGRVTGIVVDPTDANTMWISTAGGGAFITTDGGKNWKPVFDHVNGKPIYVGAIAVAPSDRDVLYLGTGEANGTSDSFYGSGVYKSTDGGRTWTLLTGDFAQTDPNDNPLDGRAVSKIVVDPTDADRMFAAVSDQAQLGVTGNAGIWRYDDDGWLNLTGDAARSNVRRNGASAVTSPSGFPATAPDTPGPDDDWRLRFRDTGAVYSDVAMSGSVLYMALAVPGTAASSHSNAVYRLTNPRTAGTSSTDRAIWYVGDGNPVNASGQTVYSSGGSNPFPTGIATPTSRNGVIKIGVSGTTIYAAIANPSSGALVDIQKSTNGGTTWAAVSSSTQPGNYLGSTGNSVSSILVLSASTVYVAGQSQISVTTTGGIVGGTGSWTTVSTTDSSGNGPHSSFYALAADSQGRILVGTAGGVWRLDPSNSNSWTNLTGNGLAASQLNSVGVVTGNPLVAFAGLSADGSAQFTNNLAWAATGTGRAGLVRVDPNDANYVYQVLGGNLFRSTTGGGPGTYTSIVAANHFSIDATNTQRLAVVGGGSLRESLDQGNNWTTLLSTSATLVAAAGFQGTFQADPDFPLVTDILANTRDVNTFYFATSNSISVTKNAKTSGLNPPTVVTRNLPGNLDNISDLYVDPRNRDTVYVTRSTTDSQGRKVFKSVDAGQNWVDITGDLPNAPVWKFLLDLRTDTLYVGTDAGVFRSIDGGTNWETFGSGLPNVSVRDVALDPALNTLTVATYGRGAYQIWLNDPQPDAGALRVISGSNIWTGPILLGAATVLNVQGNQSLQDGFSQPKLNIVGTINDLDADGNYRLTKIGGGDLVLSGANTYTGVTDILDGVVVVNNPRALGTPDGETIVTAGTALELQSDLQTELIILNGQGATTLDNHNTGALRNISNNNTFTGTLQLNTNTTIGVNSGSSLTIGSKTGLTGTGTIIDDGNNFGFVKEQKGKLILSSDNDYAGATRVEQGILNIQHGDALGSGGTGASGTTIVDGAQLQIEGDITVASEQLRVSGSGIFTTGAIQNVDGNNRWQGTVTFARDAAFAPTSTPPLNVVIGVLPSGAGDQLTIDGMIEQDGATPALGLSKVGGGRLVLNNDSNSYEGVTTVFEGALRIQQGGALGTTTNGTSVRSGAALELDGAAGSFTVAAEALTLTGTGITPANAGSLRNVAGSNTWTGSVTLQTSTTIGVDGSSQLTVSGTVQDTSPAAADPAADLTKTGTGTLVFASSNTYSGGTFVNQGILNIRNAGALGVPLVSEEQRVTLGGPLTGSFRLTFQGQTMPVSRPPTWSGSQLQADLELLSTIGAGNVSVVKSGSTYIITFQGALAGADQPELTGTGQNGTTVTIVTSREGSQGTIVASGATLQIEGGITVSTESLRLNGTGVSNRGALENVAGNNTWSSPVTLTGNASIGVDVGTDNLTITSAIGQTGGSRSVTKVGPGTLEYGGTTSNTYTGLTQVNEGTLSLNKTSATAVAGNLTIGDSVTGAATARWQSSDQVSNTAAVIVNSDGTLDLNSRVEQVGALTINAGTVSATTGDLTITTLNMTGGLVDLAGSGSSLILGGNVTATSSSGTPARIDGLGTLDLNNAARDFTISSGGEMIIDVPLADDGAEALVKRGAGLLVLDANSTFDNLSTVKLGTLQVDGGIGNVSIDGGTLEGNGSVQDISATTGGVALGPGASIGSLDTGEVDLDPSDTFFVELNNTSPGGYDQLFVDGTIDLDGATLGGTVSSSVVAGNSFTIITATVAVEDEFAQGQVAFIGGKKFDVDYNPTTVVLNRIKAEATTALVSSDNSTNYGQAFTVTATVTPETGAGAPAAADEVEFWVVNTQTSQEVSGSRQSIALTILGNGTGRAIYNPQDFVNSALAVGTYEVRATYRGGADFNPSNATPLTQTIAKTDTTTTLASNANPADYGQTVTITATVGSTVTAGPGYTVAAPSGVVTFFMNGSERGTGNLNASGQASITFPSGSFSQLDVGEYVFSATYEDGDTNYNPSATTSDLTQTVDKATTTITASAPSTTTIFGDPVDFTAQVSIVSPGSAILSGVVVFTDAFDGRELGTAELNGSGQAVLEDQVLAVGSHSITVSFAGDDNLTSSTFTFTHTIAQRDTTTNLTSNFASNNSDYGQQVTFTATIVPAGGITPVNVTGSVDFYVDNVLVGDDVTVNSNTGTATYTASSLGAGSHEIKAHYNSDSNYNDSEDTLDHFVQGTTSISLESDDNESVFGQTVTFTATVSATSPSVAAPTGTVELFDGSSSLGTQTITALNPVATFNISNLVVGSHNIRAYYHGDTNNSDSETFRTHVVVKADTATTVTSSNNSTVYGEPVTFTATVAPVSPGAGTPTGSVTFVIGSGVNTRTFSRSLSGGQAQLQVSDLVALPVGSTHPVEVTYAATADPNYNGSQGSLSPQQTVNKADTTLNLTTTNDDAVYGEPIIEATVTANSPSTQAPVGTVRFTVNAATFDVTLVNGVARLHTLNVGTYTIKAEYLGNSNFNDSNEDTQGQIIREASTTIDITSTNEDAVYGEPVIKARVTATSPSTATPNGTVRITVDNGTTQVEHNLTLSNGEVTLPGPALDVGTYTITAEYQGNSNFFASDPDDSLTQVISAASTTTTLTSSDLTAFEGQVVTFSVIVAAIAPANGTPTGSVEFVISKNGFPGDYTQTRTLVNGEAEIDLSEFTGLTVTTGTYTVRATYTPDSDNFETSLDQLDNQQVRLVPEVTTVVQAPVTTGLAFGLRLEFRNPDTGNLDVDFDDVITLTLPSGNGPSGGTLTDHDTNPVTLTAENGVAYFTTLIVDRAGTYTLQAEVEGMDDVILPSFVAGANRLEPLFANPVTAGSLFPFSFTFRALDATNNVATNFNTLPTLTLLSGPPGAVLTGGSVSVANGIGSFSGWRVNVPALRNAGAAPYVLRLAAGSLVTLITFHTVPPEGRFVDLTTSPPTTEGTPTFTYFAGPPTPAQQADLSQLREDYGFRFAGTYYFNSAGMQEKWFVSRATPLTWYIIKPDGTLHRWDGSGLLPSDFVKIDAHPATVGVLEGVNPITWDDPNLLFMASIDLSAAEQGDLSQLRADYGFYFSNSYYQNSAVGRNFNEKWFRDRSPTPTWYIIKPDGRLYQWDGSGYTDNDFIPIDAHPATPLVKDPVSPLVWDDPNLLLQAPLTLPAAQQAIVSELREDYGFYFAGSYYQNSFGRNEKWFRDRSAAPTWYILDSEGDLFKWDGSGNLNADFSQIDADPSSSAFRVDPRVWDDPDLLFRAPLTNITENPVNELEILSQTNGFKFGGSYYLNYRGENEKWFINSSNQWFYIKTDGTIHRSDGSLFDTVDRLVWDDPNLLFRARLSIATQGQLRQLRLEHGFYFTGSFAQNYLGLNEKWFRDRYNQWYVITSDGRISRWNAGTSLTFVTMVDPAVWADPHLLLLS